VRDESDKVAFEAVGSYALKVAFGHADRRIAVAGGPKNSPFAMVADNDGEKHEAITLSFFDGATGERVAGVASAHDGDIAALVGNPSLVGPAFMSVGHQGDVRFWSFQGEPLGLPAKLDIPSGFQISLATFSPDGRYAVLAWWNGFDYGSANYEIWDTATLAPIRPPVRVRGKVTAAGFSPNENMIALALYRENEAQIDLLSISGEPIATIPIAGDNSIEALTFDPQGDDLIASGSGIGIRRWQVGPIGLLDLARSRYRLLDIAGELRALNNASGEALKNYDWNTIAALMEKGRALDPNDIGVLVMLGNAYQYMQPPRLAKAAREYSRAIELDPYYSIPYLQRGRLRLTSGDFAGAAKDFTAGYSTVTFSVYRPPQQVPGSLNVNGGINAGGWVNQQRGALEFIRSRGRAYLGAGKWAEAEADFTTAIEGTPELRAAEAYAAKRATVLNFAEMAANYHAILANPVADRTPELKELRARARVERQEYDDAIDDLRAAIGLLDEPALPYSNDDAYGGKMADPAGRKRKQGELHGKLAYIFELKKDVASAKAERLAAIAVFDSAHDLAPRDPWILIERGQAKLEAGLPRAEYLADYLGAIMINPSNSSLYDDLVQILIWNEDFAGAYDTATKAVEKLTNVPPTLRARQAISAWRLGKREEASAIWLNLKAEHPGLPTELKNGSTPLWTNEQRLASELEAFSGEATHLFCPTLLGKSVH
jgi:hypothetical protein